MSMSSRPRLTLITAFFDIGREKWTTCHTRKLEHYMVNARRTLTLTDPMVVFVEPHNVDVVKTARAHLMDHTIIIERELADLRYYALKERIQSIMDSPEYQAGFPDRDPPECSQPLYDVVIWSKLDLVAEVARANPFDSTRFMWIDWGIHPHMLQQHMLSRSIMDTIHTLPERVKMLALSPVDPVSDVDIHTFYKRHITRLCAPVFSGSGDNLLKMRDMQHDEVQRAIRNGLVESEQSLWAQIWIRDPDLFDLHYGWWGECLSNWDGPRENMNYITGLVHQLEQCEQRPDAASAVRSWASAPIPDPSQW